jgi:hypothetical protein
MGFIAIKCRRTRVEQEAASNGAAYALRQEDLVVLLGNRRHHQPENVQEGAEENRQSRAVIVDEFACHGALVEPIKSISGYSKEEN